MPTYQYACTACDHAFEQVQSFTDDALTECPECHGRLRKVFNAVGVVFKGSGFYRTDSRTEAKSNGSSSSSGDGAPGASDGGSSGANGSAGSADKKTDGSGSSGSTTSSSASSSSASKSTSAA